MSDKIYRPRATHDILPSAARANIKHQQYADVRGTRMENICVKTTPEPPPVSLMRRCQVKVRNAPIHLLFFLRFFLNTDSGTSEVRLSYLLPTINSMCPTEWNEKESVLKGVLVFVMGSWC